MLASISGVCERFAGNGNLGYSSDECDRGTVYRLHITSHQTKKKVASPVRLDPSPLYVIMPAVIVYRVALTVHAPAKSSAYLEKVLPTSSHLRKMQLAKADIAGANLFAALLADSMRLLIT